MVTMLSLDKFGHARHNHDVCTFLEDSGQSLNDWIVTTAFYAAIHYCQKGLFPGDYFVDSQTKDLEYYTKFEDFLVAFRASAGSRRFSSPHKCRRWLLDSQVEEISFEYSVLDDNCHTARYKDYNVGEEDKNDSISYLDEIKNFCV